MVIARSPAPACSSRTTPRCCSSTATTTRDSRRRSCSPAAFESGADTRGAKPYLDEAEDLYRRAVKEEPAVRGGPRTPRVRAGPARAAPLAAAEELRLAASSAQGSPLRYYAEMFLGHAEESLGDHAAARDRYERAATLYPQAQSPLLALALLARQSGDRAGAQHAMRQVLALPRRPRAESDPWWRYYRWQNASSEGRFAALRAPFLDGSRR